MTSYIFLNMLEEVASLMCNSSANCESAFGMNASFSLMKSFRMFIIELEGHKNYLND